MTDLIVEFVGCDETPPEWAHKVGNTVRIPMPQSDGWVLPAPGFEGQFMGVPGRLIASNRWEIRPTSARIFEAPSRVAPEDVTEIKALLAELVDIVRGNLEKRPCGNEFEGSAPTGMGMAPCHAYRGHAGPHVHRAQSTGLRWSRL